MSKMTPASLTLSALLLCACAMHPTTAFAADREPGNAIATVDAVRQAEAMQESLEGGRYVAIGSSFAAGPMLPPPKPGAPARCGQSMNNYPTLLAERLGMVLVDRTCSGARTEHVLGPWGDIPPQIEAVDEATRLVTVTIGGNDLNYIGNLFAAVCQNRARETVGTGQKVRPCPAFRIPTEADYFRVEKQMNEIARRVRVAAPRARLVFVQYLTPLPSRLCTVTPVTEREAAVVHRIGTRLAEITGRVALQNGAIVVEMNQSSATHTPCDAEPWMIGSPKDYDGKQGMQWHLNLAGMRATADGIAYWLGKAGTNPAIPQQTMRVAEKASAPATAAPQAAPEAALVAPQAQTAIAPERAEGGKASPGN